MTTQIQIEILHGNAFVADDDRERAESAALAVLARAGVSVADAAAEYRRQWDEFDDENPMSGAALIWIEARAAADIALTEGWADPSGACCSINA